MTDRDLIKGIQRGSMDCADTLIERYYPVILRYCAWHCPSADLAEDLTQEVFLRLFQSLPRFLTVSSVKSYLYTIAHNLCVDQYRRQSVLPLEERIPDGDDRLSQIEDRAAVLQLLAPLPDTQREALLLRYGEGLTYREISRITGVPARTVQSRVRLAIQTIRKEKP